MAESLARLIEVPALTDLFDRQMKGLKGVGWSRHTKGFSVGGIECDGVPNADYDLVIAIITEGGLNVGEFQYSLDGGATYSTTQLIPDTGIFVLPNTGCTLTFDDAGETLIGFQVGDEWRITLTQNGFPVTSWQPFSTPLTLIENDAEALQSLFAVVYYLGTGGFLGTAQGAWLDILAEQTFGDPRREGLPAQGVVELTDHGSGPFTFAPGDLIVSTAAGLRYQNTEAFTLNQNSTLAGVAVQAELIGVAYNAGNDSVVVMVSTQAGVTVNNPDPGNGTWLTRGGTDRETDKQLAQRLMAKWPARGFGAPTPDYDTWAKTASDAVTKTTTRIDQTTGGLLHLYLAGPGGGVTPAVVAAVQAYVNPRAPQCVSVLVESAATVALDVTGTVFVFSGFEILAAVQIQKNLASLIDDLPIGGTVYLDQVRDAIMANPDPGKPRMVRNMTLTNPVADLALTATQVAALTNSLIFVTV